MPQSKTKLRVAFVQVLNRPGHHSTAAISGQAERSKWPKKQTHPYNIDADFNISDCARQVTIELSSDDRPSYLNSVAKLKKIEDAARFMREQMERLVTEWEPS